MKTQFSISDLLYDSYLEDFEDLKLYYVRMLKEYGFVLDHEMEDVYIIFNEEIHLNEGDRVDLLGYKIVEWKCIDLINGIIKYKLSDE